MQQGEPAPVSAAAKNTSARSDALGDALDDRARVQSFYSRLEANNAREPTSWCNDVRPRFEQRAARASRGGADRRHVFARPLPGSAAKIPRGGKAAGVVLHVAGVLRPRSRKDLQEELDIR